MNAPLADDSVPPTAGIGPTVRGQFSLRRLLLWVAVSGVVFGLCRWQRETNPLPRSATWQAVWMVEIARLWWNSLSVIQVLATIRAREFARASSTDMRRWRQAVGFGVIPLVCYVAIFALMVSTPPGGVASRVVVRLAPFLALAQLINAALAWIAFRSRCPNPRVETLCWIVVLNSLTPVGLQCCGCVAVSAF